jgi:hypothetical protein
LRIPSRVWRFLDGACGDYSGDFLGLFKLVEHYECRLATLCALR